MMRLQPLVKISKCMIAYQTSFFHTTSTSLFAIKYNVDHYYEPYKVSQYPDDIPPPMHQQNKEVWHDDIRREAIMLIARGFEKGTYRGYLDEALKLMAHAALVSKILISQSAGDEKQWPKLVEKLPRRVH